MRIGLTVSCGGLEKLESRNTESRLGIQPIAVCLNQFLGSKFASRVQKKSSLGNQGPDSSGTV